MSPDDPRKRLRDQTFRLFLAVVRRSAGGRAALGFCLGLLLAGLAFSACQSRQAPPATARPVGAVSGTFLDRHPQADLRLVSYNVYWNSIFPEVNHHRAAKFVRLVRALDADVLALQEIGRSPGDGGGPAGRHWTAQDAASLMNTVAPLPGGAGWHAFQGKDNVILSKYPLKLTTSQTVPPGEREQAVALVDLPDERFKVDLYLLANHFKCCDPERYDPARQKQADAITSWLRDARTPGGQLDLPPGTPLVIAGDLNIVGSFQPVQTLLDGDISDEQLYGPDFAPDWDDTALTDARPLHNLSGPEDWTWRDDTSQFKPGRLDFVIYSDSVLEVVRQFVLNTTTMSDAELAACGLQKFDTALDDVGKRFDHLPLVVDFRFK